MAHDIQQLPTGLPEVESGHTAAEPPVAPAWRRHVVPIALATVSAALLVLVVVLAAMLVGARSTASETAAADRVETEAQAEELRNAERVLAKAENRLAQAEAETDGLLVLAGEAEAARADAEAAAAPADAVLDEFLGLLRDSDPAFLSVPDDSLVELGQSTCDYLDTFGNSEENIAHVIDVGVASGIPALLSMEVTSSALVVLCPQHELD